jgi:CDP-4-dehydro-6-deoxyglucose reductase, E1
MEYKLTTNTFDNRETKAAISVIKSGKFTLGKNVKSFEEKFAKKFNRKYAIMVNSGSSANLLSIASLFYKKKNFLKPGDEVIVPAIAWSTSYFPLIQYGLKIRLCDVDTNTLNVDLNSLKKKINKKTKLIVAVSILGNPVNFNEIKKICDKNKIILFEDNCESLGAKIGKKFTGEFGELSTSSFFFSHHISTGEGGIITTNSRELYDICRSLRAHGWTRDIKNSKIFKKKKSNFHEQYRFILPGYNVRPQEINAAMGLVQLKKFDEMIKIRRKNAKTFQDIFGKNKNLIIQKENGFSSWFSFTLIVKKNKTLNREKVLKLLKKHKIHFRTITGGNIADHDVIKYLNVPKSDLKLPKARYVHRNGFFIGNFPKDLTFQLNRLKEILNKII